MNEQSTLTIGQVAWLKVVDVNHLGAFVDWGLSKDLFVPFAEQQHPLKLPPGAGDDLPVDRDGLVDRGRRRLRGARCEQ